MDEKKKEEEPVRINKMKDLISMIRAGAPVTYVHDRDSSFFIYSILTEKSQLGGESLDDFEIFIYFQGFLLVRVIRSDKGGKLKYQAVEYINNFQKKVTVADPLIAINLFLDKNDTKIEMKPNSLLLMVAEPAIIDGNISISATLREHYNNLVSSIQVKAIKPKGQSGLGAAKTGGVTGSVVQQEAMDDYTPSKRDVEKIRPIVILGNTSELPHSLAGYVLNAGIITRNLVPMKTLVPESLTTGLTCTEQTTLTRIMEITPEKNRAKLAIPLIKRYRKAVFSSTSLIQELDDTYSLDNFGGYPALKEFIEQRKRLLKKVDKMEEHKIVLKGLFLAGLPGSGKSILLEALGNYWGLPSYSLQLENILGKYVGESESNLVSTLESLEKLAPCYVMIDEIDKALAGVGEGQVAGSDVPLRIFGILLKFMARPNGVIFGVSANAVSGIPEAFHRRGRFDRIFFMGLPDATARAHILAIHLKKRGYELDKLNKQNSKVMKDTLEFSNGFTGAELENAVHETVVRCIDEETVLTPEMLYQEVSTTKTIDRSKGEIEKLSTWAKTYATNAQ